MDNDKKIARPVGYHIKGKTPQERVEQLAKIWNEFDYQHYNEITQRKMDEVSNEMKYLYGKHPELEPIKLKEYEIQK